MDLNYPSVLMEYQINLMSSSLHFYFLFFHYNLLALVLAAVVLAAVVLAVVLALHYYLMIDNNVVLMY